MSATQPESPSRLVPLAEAAAAVGFSKASLYRFANEGRLQLMRLGDRTFVESDELERFRRDNARPFAPGRPVGDGGASRRRAARERRRNT